MSFSVSVATNLLESGVNTRAPNWLFPCVISTLYAGGLTDPTGDF